LATEKSSIKLNGTSIEITNFTITDSTVVSVFKNEEDNGTNLSTYLENVISIGTKTLGLASAGAGVERLKDSITAAQDAIAGNVKNVLTPKTGGPNLTLPS
jgi:hypothetical protein